ncbi:zf-HC2 domain-containing protein [Thalassotalea sp. G20_0]|uniref:anti-sigma factor family protein n=1 Tax=Thalassotalea sp. G20_0 TaxID=2821093 RepID=UPI001AD9893D|nr:zf-HC2 domain-containing protein [Thalassotalea sp. G20_0]MBO9493112.1 zf-HC2 domain-containing protein [Thalassotalea sp. G20_0]
MLKCRDIEQMAGQLQDDELNWRQRLSMRMHLIMCHHCRRFLKQFAVIKKLAEHSVSEPASDDEVKSVMDKINGSPKG